MPSSLHFDSLPIATPTPYGPSSLMIATLMSFTSLPSLDLAFSAMNCLLPVYRDLDVLHVLAERGFGVLGDELAGGFAELVGMHLRAEHIVELLVLQHRGGDAGVDPHEFLRRVDLGGHRHAMRAREHAHDDVDLLLVEQPLGLVDRDVGLRLRVRDDADDLVALDAAALVDQVDRDLVADAGGLR